MSRRESVPCTHCGLPARPVGDEARAPGGAAFCCSGCCLAHHLAPEGVTGSADRLLARVLLGAVLSMGVMMLSLSLYGAMLGEEGDFESESAQALQGLQRMAALFLSAPVLYLLGMPLLEAVVRMRRWLSADALIVLGTGSAWLVSGWNSFRGGGEVYFDTATMVLVLVGLGRWLDLSAKERARARLVGLLPERERPAAVIEGDGERAVPVEELEVGQRLRLRPGEVVPADGVVLSGRSFVDTSDMTGEEEPRSVGPGDRLLAGTRLVDGSLELEARAVGGDRLCAEVERLLEEALARPAAGVVLADRVARVLIPVVLVLALAAAVWHWPTMGAEGALLTALSVILVACPCSLGIATPLAFWVALGRAFRMGVLVRGGDVLERLARARRVGLDKTGTLTDGSFELRGLRTTGTLDEGEALRLAASLETGSEHPIGRALVQAWRERRGPEEELEPLQDFRALPGIGVEGELAGARWCLRRGAVEGEVELAREGEPLAWLRLHSEPRPEAREVVAALREAGLEPVVLTGDGRAAAERLGGRLGIEVLSELSPADKVERLRAWGPERTVFVGDGLNDAAALAAAGVGVSVAGGSPRSMDAASVNLLRPGLASLPELLRLARRATRVARWNLFWAFGYNAVALLLALSGHLPPIAAAAAMVASSVVVVLNSGRLAQEKGAPGREGPAKDRDEAGFSLDPAPGLAEE